MASKDAPSASYSPDVLEAARQLVEDRERRSRYAKEPWWTCGACGFNNYPRAALPGHSKCEQCGKERDEYDRVVSNA